VLFLFLDGVGIGTSDPGQNPFLTARLPTLRGLLGGALPTLDEPYVEGDGARAFPLDANLGLEGRPQSGTGQTALLTGENTARLFGRHFGPWTPTSLRPMLAERNVLVRAQAAGRSATFANAYPRGFLDRVPTRRQAAPPLAAQAAGVLNRNEQHLARGEAVASEIVNSGWRTGLGFVQLPEISSEEAGHNLATVARSHDLTFYAHYRTDQAGHTGERAAAHDALERVDSFLAGIVANMDHNTLLLVASDHGNVESLDGKHTRNPVMGLIVSKGRIPAGEHPTSITDVCELILGWIAQQRA